MSSRPIIRSMFHRRLSALFVLLVLASLVLAHQSYRLTVVQGKAHLELAEDRLVADRWTPTLRGRILDRKGRVLAHDEPSFDILADYPVISGEWARTRAVRQARRENRAVWGSLKPDQRQQLIQQAQAGFDAQLDTLWRDLTLALELSPGELDAIRDEIRQRVDRQANSIWARWLEEFKQEQSKRRGEPVEATIEDVKRPLAIHVEPHLLAHGVSERVAFAVRRLALTAPGLHIEPGGRRAYPFESVTVEMPTATLPEPLRPSVRAHAEAEEAGPHSPPPAPPPSPPKLVTVTGVAGHILGWLRQVQAEDTAARPRVDASTGAIDRGFYQPQDLVGARGIEASAERALRGLRGRRVRHLDIPLDEPGAEDVTEPQSGADVPLTIDIMLQARIQAAMDPAMGLAVVQPWHQPPVMVEGQPPLLPSGTRLNGAAVVIDVETGDILALVTTPTFTREQLQTDPASLFEDVIDSPWLNRAVAKPYPPGSIVKPLVLAAAVTEGVHPVSRAVECTGSLNPEKPDQFRCWVFKQFGTTHQETLGRPLLAPEAMAVSCNIFFYTLGRELGPERLTNWYRKFGVGGGNERGTAGPGLGIDDVYPGSVGIPPAGERLSLSHAILMAIGQGPVAWTPLHAADAYATLARGGLRIFPRLLKNDRPRASDIAIDPAALDAAMEGLRQSVQEDYGTGHHLRYPDGTREPIITPRPGISVIGKTGTAEAPQLFSKPADPSQPREVLRRGDHSWYVILVGPANKRPAYAVAVIMEYAGSGGRVSGPICNQIVEALIAEGYL